ncbi:PREDICTED: ultraviolet-B receptor UVR8-like isoform X1 [Camelina sativa]|uniref:Ultraviolet-B receptor UVR8-like isoform X1 n=2 Tax=Camelina sativa TaxID=90675 RepID=A0ABM0VA48_CAMSA|nr:PREDICTED: ultraviolet-B receptor UVR8-like isoform X1 [Camelina sativa]
MEEDKAAALPISEDLSRKIISIAAGEAHTIALTGDGCVYSWGRGMFGRLGTGKESDELVPVRVDFEFPDQVAKDRARIVGIAAGAYHSLAVSDDGSVWSWGYNIYGQLGFDGENSLAPYLIKSFFEQEGSSSSLNDSKARSDLKVCTVKAGSMMSLAIDSVGGLWMWGNVPPQDSGTEPPVSFTGIPIPFPIPEFHDRTVLKVACGDEHVVALVGPCGIHKDNNYDDSVLYSWGNNHRGQLGLGDRERRAIPQIVETFNQDSGLTVYDIACGAHHTALLTYRKETPEGPSICWTFGFGENGQLGHGSTKSSSIPEPVSELPEHSYLVSVDCGLFHTSVVSSEGYVWSWGMERGLGLCPDVNFTEVEAGDDSVPRKISGGSKFRDPVQVSCGAAHTVLVANGGYKLWSWGRGRNGVLGSGDVSDHYVPTLVFWPNELKSEKEEVPDAEKSASTEEMKRLESKLMVMERYASILHGSIFGKPFNEEEDIPYSLRVSGYFDMGKEWGEMLESADKSQLMRLQAFYVDMIGRVKDKVLQRRIQEIMKDCLQSSAPRH